MILFFVRHGDPIYSPDSLTPLGHRQAEAVGRRLARYGLDEVYSSPMIRAQDTAKPAAEMTKHTPIICDWASESAAWEQMSVPTEDGGQAWFFATKRVKERFVSPEIRDMGHNWLNHPEFRDTPAAQGYLRIRKATREFLKSEGFEWDEEKGLYKNLNRPRPERRIALFAHHGFGTSFLSAVLDIPYPQICVKCAITHTGVTVIYFDESGEETVPQLLTLSDCGHLLADNLPEHYDNWLYF